MSIRYHRSPRSSFGRWVQVRRGDRIVRVWQWDTLGQLRFVGRLGEVERAIAAGYRWQRRWGWLVWLFFALVVGALVFAVVGGVHYTVTHPVRQDSPAIRAARVHWTASVQQQPVTLEQDPVRYEAWLDRVAGAQW